MTARTRCDLGAVEAAVTRRPHVLPASADRPVDGVVRALAVREAASEALAQWDAFESGLVGLVSRLATLLHAQHALVWWPNEKGRLVPRRAWTARGATPARERSRWAAVEASSLVHAAWSGGEPVFGPDTERELGKGLDAVASDCVVIPAVWQGSPLAALSFHAHPGPVPDQPLARALRAVGLDLGRQLARHRRELGDRRLSTRELEVLQLAADGLIGPAIAERLVISQATVKTHFQHIYEKLGATDRASAVAHAIRAGLVS